jgi:hypothetical protein
MGHAINRRAFRDADVTEPFFRLYTLLVAVELALKDAIGTHPMTHDLDALVKQHLGANTSSSLEAQLTTLQLSLSALVCTVKGTQASVRANKYPDLRYLQHSADGFANGSTSADVSAALADTHGLITELAMCGVVL